MADGNRQRWGNRAPVRGSGSPSFLGRSTVFTLSAMSGLVGAVFGFLGTDPLRNRSSTTSMAKTGTRKRGSTLPG